jgi:hypothetical protein
MFGLAASFLKGLSALSNSPDQRAAGLPKANMNIQFAQLFKAGRRRHSKAIK